MISVLYAYRSSTTGPSRAGSNIPFPLLPTGSQASNKKFSGWFRKLPLRVFFLLEAPASSRDPKSDSSDEEEQRSQTNLIKEGLTLLAVIIIWFAGA